METIFKYELDLTDVQTVQMPQGARVLSTQDQRGRLCIWAQVDDSKPKVARHFRIVGTGNPCPDMHRLTFIGSVQQGPFVWHVFEITT